MTVPPNPEPSQAHGWEILPSLCAHAKGVADKYLGADPTSSPLRRRIRFHAADALEADLSPFSVVVVAGRCCY